MRLNVSKRKNGRTYLSIEKRYRDKVTKKSTGTTIRSLGYLDELEKEFPDPIAHFKAVAKQMTAQENTRRKVSITIDMDERVFRNHKLGGDPQKLLYEHVARKIFCQIFAKKRYTKVAQ